MIDRVINTTGSLRESRKRVMPDLGKPISERIDDTNNSSEIMDEDGVIQEE